MSRDEIYMGEEPEQMETIELALEHQDKALTYLESQVADILGALNVTQPPPSKRSPEVGEGRPGRIGKRLDSLAGDRTRLSRLSDLLQVVLQEVQRL